MEDIYRQRLKHFVDQTAALDRLSGRLANGRLLFFLVAAGLALAATFHRVPQWGWWGALASFVLFLVLATWHSRVIEDERRAKAGAELNQRGLDRLAGKWHDFPARGDT